MTIFDYIITNSIPHLPKWFAKPFSKPYVAGETVEEALSEIRHLNSKGFSATIDILGEHIEDTDLARDITHQYLNPTWVGFTEMVLSSPLFSICS